MKKILMTVFGIFAAAGLHAQEADTVVMEKREEFIIEDKFHNPDRQGDAEKSNFSLDRYYDVLKQKEGGHNFYGKDGIKIITTSRRNREPRNVMRHDAGHWAGIGLSYNGLVANLGKLSLPAGSELMSQSAKSIGVTINPISYTFGVSRKTGFVTGFGFEFNNFRFNDDISLKRENGITSIDTQYIERGINLKKSKLSAYYLNIPLLFEIQFGRDNQWFLNGGVVGGLLIGSHTKIKADHPELKGKYKQHGGLGLRNFHYGYTVNAGIKNFALTATYYDGGLFRKGMGPGVKHVNVGLMFMW